MVLDQEILRQCQGAERKWSSREDDLGMGEKKTEIDINWKKYVKSNWFIVALMEEECQNL